METRADALPSAASVPPGRWERPHPLTGWMGEPRERMATVREHTAGAQ